MNRRHEALLALLADGALHSSADLAPRLGISRAAVSKLVGELRQHGVAVESVPRSGYRLPQPVELLDAGRIRGALDARGWPLADRLQVLFETGSTNTYLYDAPAPPPARPRVVFAELQQAGRGRRGRSWLAPFGSGLTFSDRVDVRRHAARPAGARPRDRRRHRRRRCAPSASPRRR